MKKDLLALAFIALIAAIALTVAAVRGALPLLKTFNPLATWSLPQRGMAMVIVLIIGALAMLAIIRNDRGLPWPSATLEWVYSSDTAKTIGASYGDGELRSRAIRGVVIDSVAFIPAYILLIAFVSFSVASGWTSHPEWASWIVALGWSVALAGALDYLENAGIYAVLGGVTTHLAPLTYAACQLKWVIAFTAADFAILGLLGRIGEWIFKIPR